MAQNTKLEEGIKQILLDHQAYTKIAFDVSGGDNDRHSYECDCGAKETDTDLLGNDWLATHRTNEVVALMSRLGVRA